MTLARWIRQVMGWIIGMVTMEILGFLKGCLLQILVWVTTLTGRLELETQGRKTLVNAPPLRAPVQSPLVDLLHRSRQRLLLHLATSLTE
jgi:type III secretory pathway component EscT